ncbi:MAG: methylated-DNA--[protein]-cysteine S-methyltransferase [Lachnospiraceae bacterium]|nr:methylated-DNA--[protein]-cysteine S-methyltransferase [Lachnospiraceae bacterium]
MICQNPKYINHYQSPVGGILLAADETGLTGLWFDGAKYYAAGLDTVQGEKDTPILERTKEWLAIYFSGREPDFLPPVHMEGTPFQLAVWKILQKIPYGRTVTYKEIAREIASKKNLATMSAQAVGGAVGHNKISIIVPCHRVVGADGSLTGYAGGIDKKVQLLALEKASAHYDDPNYLPPVFKFLR